MSISPSQTDTDDLELMASFGITRVPAYQYHYKDWRYSNLAEAMAQARRDGAAPAE
jgi:hypothetical protein